MVRFSRLFLSAGIGGGLMLLAAQFTGPVVAQEKAKAKPRIAINDLEKLKADNDFLIQGEYEGTVLGGKDKIGAHVIAKGEGKFDVKVYMGGLPGAGWDGKAPVSNTAVRSKEEPRADLDRENKTAPQGIINKGSESMIFTLSVPMKEGKEIVSGMSKVERKSTTMGAKPPKDAIVLFGEAGDEKNWNGGKIIELSDGKFLNTGIKSKQSFTNFKAHVEFRLPWMPNSTGQQRGNSGVYLQDRYEVQVLDSFGLKGENNECGGIYTMHKPSVNMCYPPMVWQTYDIDFTAATYDGDKKTANAKVTILHNGVKIHDGAEIKKETGGGQPEKASPGPIQLQNHGDPLVFRNLWIVETK